MGKPIRVLVRRAVYEVAELELSELPDGFLDRLRKSPCETVFDDDIWQMIDQRMEPSLGEAELDYIAIRDAGYNYEAIWDVQKAKAEGRG